MVPGVTVIFVTTCSTKFVLYSLELEDCTTVILQDQNFDNSVAEWIIVLDISCWRAKRRKAACTRDNKVSRVLSRVPSNDV